MTERDRGPSSGEARAVVRSDELVLFVFLLLLSVAALAVFLHYTVSILDGLPDVLPVIAPR